MPDLRRDGIVVKKKKTARKASKRATRKPGKAKKTVRKAVRKPALKSSRKAAPARKSAGKKSPRAATKKAKSSRPAGSRKAGLPSAAAAVVPMAAAASTSGENYGREGWREEELSAAEIDTDAPELDELEADSEGDEPAIGGDADDETEW
jgi:hypothetical protein